VKIGFSLKRSSCGRYYPSPLKKILYAIAFGKKVIKNVEGFQELGINE
jgi:hypothetical protein